MNKWVNKNCNNSIALNHIGNKIQLYVLKGFDIFSTETCF